MSQVGVSELIKVQDVHAVLPLSLANVYVSTAQLVQAVACKAELNLPAAHFVHVVAALAEDVNVPWVHSVHVTGPLAFTVLEEKYPAAH